MIRCGKPVQLMRGGQKFIVVSVVFSTQGAITCVLSNSREQSYAFAFSSFQQSDQEQIVRRFPKCLQHLPQHWSQVQLLSNSSIAEQRRLWESATRPIPQTQITVNCSGSELPSTPRYNSGSRR